MSEGPQLHIDDDWKAQARAEKQRLVEKEKAKQDSQPSLVMPDGSDASQASDASSATQETVSQKTTSPSNASEAEAANSSQTSATPPADFRALVSSIASQCMLYLGMIPEPQSGQRMVGLDYARQQLGLLEVLEDKTDGNLSDEESTLLAMMLYRLRSQYVQVAQAMRPVPEAG